MVENPVRNWLPLNPDVLRHIENRDTEGGDINEYASILRSNPKGS